MKNILKFAAALFVLSSTAPIYATSSVSPAPQSAQHRLEAVLVQPTVGTARFTPPQFCWINQVKVACDFTALPPRDPGK